MGVTNLQTQNVNSVNTLSGLPSTALFLENLLSPSLSLLFDEVVSFAIHTKLIALQYKIYLYLKAFSLSTSLWNIARKCKLYMLNLSDSQRKSNDLCFRSDQWVLDELPDPLAGPPLYPPPPPPPPKHLLYPFLRFCCSRITRKRVGVGGVESGFVPELGNLPYLKSLFFRCPHALVHR